MTRTVGRRRPAVKLFSMHNQFIFDIYIKLKRSRRWSFRGILGMTRRFTRERIIDSWYVVSNRVRSLTNTANCS